MRFARALAVAVLSAACGTESSPAPQWLHPDGAVAPAAPRRGDAWLQPAHDALRSRRSTAVVGRGPTFRWQIALSLPPTAVAPVTDADDNVYIAEGRVVRSFDAAGAARWSADLSPPSDPLGVVFGLAIDPDGHLVVTGPLTQLSWLDRGNGLLLHSVPKAADYWVTEPTIGADGSVYFGGYGGVSAYSSEGVLRWVGFPDVASFRVNEVAIAPGGDLVAASSSVDTPNPNSDHPALFRLDASGALRWSKALSPANVGDSVRAPAIADDGTIWLARTKSTFTDYGTGPVIFAFQPDGTALGSAGFQKLLQASPAVDAYGDAVIAHLDGTSATRKDGSIRWSAPPGFAMSPALDGAGVAIIGDGQLHGVLDGVELWSAGLSDGSTVATGGVECISIGADGTLYVIARNPDRLVAIR